MSKARLWLTLGALGGALTVALGAFGAHALKGQIAAESLAIWQTATDYLGLHALALFGCGLLSLQRPQLGAAQLAGWLFAIGVALFSGSLFALALSGLRPLGFITPVGGVTLILGWLALARAAWRIEIPPNPPFPKG